MFPAVDPGEEAAAAKLWAVYISEAEKYDKRLVESWKSDMQGMLIFAGLFSASLTAFLIESYKTLNVDSGDATVQLLARISQQLEASANGSPFPVPQPKSFTPTTASVVCNMLWFISLGLSLACALIATLLDQWARDFLHRSEIRSAPLIRARIFSYLYYGLKRFNMHTIVEIIPLLLHTSLFLIFAGLVAFLIPVNPIMTAIAALILLTVATIYSILTLLPLRYFDCPYRTPLSGGFWRLSQSYQRIWARSTESILPFGKTLIETMARRAVEESDDGTIRDGRALLWTVKSLSDDSELEPFVEGIPDVLWGSSSSYPWGPPTSQRYSYSEHIRELVLNSDVRLCGRIENYMRSCDTGLLSSEAQKRRLIASYKALWAITTLFHTKQFPMQSPLDFSRWTRFFNHPDDSPDILHYSLSARSLMSWSSINANQSRVTEFSRYLAKCRADIEQGREPDTVPIKLFARNLPWWHPLSVEIQIEDRITDNQISAIQSQIDTLECNIRFEYLERGARLDSEPYLWRETLRLLELPSFNFSKCQGRLERAINIVVVTRLQKDNTEKLRWHWIDQIVHELFRLWKPISSTVIPSGIITYLIKRTAGDLPDLGWPTGNDSWVPSFLSCFPVTLYNSPPGVTQDELLAALWRGVPYLDFHNLDWSVYSSVLEALVNSATSAVSISVTVLVKAQLYHSLRSATTDENWWSRFNHPLLPTETAVAAEPESIATMTTDNYMSPIEQIVGIRIDEAKVCLLAEFIELCAAGPFPYKAVETLQKIDHCLYPTSVHDIHQKRLAQAIEKLLESSRGTEVLGAVVDLDIFEAYVDDFAMNSWEPCPPWLTSSDARNTIKITFSAYAEKLSNSSPSDPMSTLILFRPQKIIERLGSLHPEIEKAPSTADLKDIAHVDSGDSSWANKNHNVHL
ncbi:hypothetical protein B0H19DRAFT_1272259 [Mycena capillaripes]|nr:hypothetical protein B0H19DRAFT_1272259 [Mycena capillaripes]